ncbi:apolipoprotein N-acyltransferase [Roseospirillum parvum]|uniref:Apolipoprotein N-acyltransferase n=1 Tax=Roseospirillum parvum TaxID=83401 RepID=A0A1G8DM62_9PROT|nr:apolipoprotein N-acyltransferase [Roseospirillum parvum]SDH58655.1 apolipoprotein N-acyltransferase [Roseospirillum parvum]
MSPSGRLVGRLSGMSPGRWAGMSRVRRAGLALLAGALSALALPPWHLLPLLPLGLTALLGLTLTAGSTGRAALTGWAFGTGFFALGLYWVGEAFLVDAERFAWLLPIAMPAFAGGLALYHALVGGLLWRLAGGAQGAARPLTGALLLAALWVLAELLRGWLFTGFPWNPLAAVWMPVDALLQPVAWVGVAGLSLLTALAALAPAPWLAPGRRRAWMSVALLTPLLLAGGAGALRLSAAPGLDDPAAVVPGVRLRLVQPAIPQADKWKPELRVGHVERQIALSRAPGFEDFSLVIWAETAVPFALGRQDAVFAAVAAAAPPGGAVITGAPRLTPPGAPIRRMWNSVVALDDQGRQLALYDKQHLVPFGEYVPFSDLLPLPKLTEGGTDFSPGQGPRRLILPGLPPASPLVCYEIIFPEAVVDRALVPRPQWLLNLTNDGWFGSGPGPRQHFALARLRAVESALPVVRVANTGISAVIDSHGRVRGRLDLFERGVLDADLPRPAATPVLAGWRNPVMGGLALGIIVVVVALRSKSKKTAHE